MTVQRVIWFFFWVILIAIASMLDDRAETQETQRQNSNEILMKKY